MWVPVSGEAGLLIKGELLYHIYLLTTSNRPKTVLGHYTGQIALAGTSSLPTCFYFINVNLGQDVWCKCNEDFFIMVCRVRHNLIASTEQTRVADVDDEMARVKRWVVLFWQFTTMTQSPRRSHMRNFQNTAHNAKLKSKTCLWYITAWQLIKDVQKLTGRQLLTYEGKAKVNYTGKIWFWRRTDSRLSLMVSTFDR